MHEQSEVETTGENRLLRTARERLGQRRRNSRRSNFVFYEPADGQGCVLYGDHPFFNIPNISILVVILRQYATIEKLIHTDRRRPEGQERLLQAFYGIFARYGVGTDLEKQLAVVEMARTCWQQGHPLLKTIAEKCNPRQDTSWPVESTKRVFGEAYFADSFPINLLLGMKYARIEREWQEQGRCRLPYYFARFGVITAESYFRERQAQAVQEAWNMKGL